MKNLVLSLMIFFSSLSVAHAQTNSEGYETNGGDAVCAEFLEIFDELAKTLSKALLSKEDATILSAMISKRSIVALSSVPDLTLDGYSKDAINYPTLETPKIVLSQNSWARLSLAQKKLLVLHEMLPIARFSDKDHSLSARLIAIANALPPMTARRMENIRNAFKSCDEDFLSTLNPASLKDMTLVNLPELTFNSWKTQCSMAFDILSTANWDYNKCNSGKQTALARALAEQYSLETLVLFLDRAEALSARESLQNIKLIIKNIVIHGGTLSCSGYYP